MVKLIFLTLFSWFPSDDPGDSLRMETINGKQFIIHQVSEKETLYAISRRYGTPVTAILEYNSKAASSLEVGQIIQVPYVPKTKTSTTGGATHKVAAGETLFSISRQYNVSVEELKQWNNLTESNLTTGQELIVRKSGQTTTPVGQKGSPGSHVVAQKETLFSISKLYGVTVQQLKDWNGLTGEELKIGQTLKVSVPAAAVVTQTQQTTTVQPQETKISETISGSDETKEAGLAELIEGTEGNRKYLALHRSVKSGSIIKVRNELNNREVFVRVVGQIPNTGVNDKLVVKISKSAYDRLGAIDPKFRVEVTYYK